MNLDSLNICGTNLGLNCSNLIEFEMSLAFIFFNKFKFRISTFNQNLYFSIFKCGFGSKSTF